MPLPRLAPLAPALLRRGLAYLAQRLGGAPSLGCTSIQASLIGPAALAGGLLAAVGLPSVAAEVAPAATSAAASLTATGAPSSSAPLQAPANAPAAALIDASLAANINRVAQEAAAASDPELMAQVLGGIAGPGAHAPGSRRLEVRVGQLDSRLRLAPCARVQTYWPSGQRTQGLVRIGLRCMEGAKAWNVYLPIQLIWWGPSLVATGPLPVGTVLTGEHLRIAEVALNERQDPALRVPQAVLGRQLNRPLAPGQALRQGDLKLREWMRPGDTVKLVTNVGTVLVTGEAQALTPGLEGQTVRARTESGRIVQGVASGERQITVSL